MDLILSSELRPKQASQRVLFCVAFGVSGKPANDRHAQGIRTIFRHPKLPPSRKLVQQGNA
eukprot:4305976-Lingulodinium_polyedra.AAC.1